MNLRLLCASAVLLAASLPAAAVDVGVSIQISEPGVYGRIDLGPAHQRVAGALACVSADAQRCREMDACAGPG